MINNKIKKEFEKWKIKLLVWDKLITFIIILIILFKLLRPDLFIISVYILIIPYMILTKRTSALKHLILTSFIAIIWVFIAKDYYSYNHDMIQIFGLNSYPLFAWSSGLFAMYLIYSHWEYKLKKRTWYTKLILFSLIYEIILISLETIAYHVFNIKDLATAAYPGLPICDCIHSPIWMQATYLLLGPFYILLVHFMKVKNPHLLKNIKETILKKIKN